MKDAQNSNQVRDLARSLDCITDEDLQSLACVKASTTEAWRKRGTGPEYIRLGNRFLYPRKSVSKHLESITKVRSEVPAKGVL